MSNLCVLGHGMGANNEPLEREAEVGLLCLWHRNRMSRLLADVRDLWVDLAFIVEAGSAPKDDMPRTRHTKAAEAPAPANLEVLALRDRRTSPARLPAVNPAVDSAGDQSTPYPPVVEQVASWVLLVTEERPLTTVLPKSTIGQLELLMRHGDWIAGQEWVEPYIDEMTELRKALSAALRDRTHRRVGTCRLPAEDRDGLCGGALLEENGGDGIKCATCQASWTTPTERAMLAVTLEGA